MRLSFQTLNDRKYSLTLERYKATKEKVASNFQWEWKLFFMDIFPNDFWCEEFLVRPLLKYRYRADLFNFTRKFIVEIHGAQHVSVNSHFHSSQDKFLDALVKDREKELWCEKNKIELITVYNSTPMKKEFFVKKYSKIKW